MGLLGLCCSVNLVLTELCVLVLKHTGRAGRKPARPRDLDSCLLCTSV